MTGHTRRWLEDQPMGRKTKITKEMILEAAYELLDESGIGAVAIKLIAERLGCSTQPISWQFGSMTELKKELYLYCGNRVWGELEKKMAGKSAIEAYFATGVNYITVACDHPNVFRFLNVDNPIQTIGEDILEGQSVFSLQMNEESVKILAKEFNIPKKKIGEAVQNTVIYTHGLATMMIWDDYRLPKEKALKMIYDMGIRMLADAGVEKKHLHINLD